MYLNVSNIHMPNIFIVTVYTIARLKKPEIIYIYIVNIDFRRLGNHSAGKALIIVKTRGHLIFCHHIQCWTLWHIYSISAGCC